jgi:hypothetical protein
MRLRLIKEPFDHVGGRDDCAHGGGKGAALRLQGSSRQKDGDGMNAPAPSRLRLFRVVIDRGMTTQTFRCFYAGLCG